MQIVIGNVLAAEEVALVRETLARATFEDGRETAGFAARLVKENLQATNDRKVETVRRLVEERILGNELFGMAVRPKALTAVMFSRYESGMQYGSHVDDALMAGMRTDVSFTLFLSEPESYDGGELAIEGVSGEETFSMDGVVDCAHGTSVSDPSSATFGGSQNRGRFTFHVVKTLTCDDPIGTFKLLVDVAQNADRSGTTGGFTAGEGTGAFAGIRGGGEIHGTNYPDGSGITDVYTGRLTIAP